MEPAAIWPGFSLGTHEVRTTRVDHAAQGLYAEFDTIQLSCLVYSSSKEGEDTSLLSPEQVFLETCSQPSVSFNLI